MSVAPVSEVIADPANPGSFLLPVNIGMDGSRTLIPGFVTTVNSNILLVAMYTSRFIPNNDPVVSSISCAGLSFSRVDTATGLDVSNTEGVTIDLWYANLTGPLTNEPIAITLSVQADNAAAAVVGLIGSNGFDTGTGLPGVAGSPNPLKTIITTSDPSDLILYLGAQQVNAVQGYPTNYTLLFAGHAALGARWMDIGVGGYAPNTTLTAYETDSPLASAPNTMMTVAVKGTVVITVPNVVGQSQATATANIIAATLTLGSVTSAPSGSVPTGDVISQSPAAGSTAFTGDPVAIVISTGSAVVPDVVGETQAAATADILAANLGVGTVTFQYTSSVPPLPPQPAVLPARAIALGYKLVWPLDGGTGSRLATNFSPGAGADWWDFNLLNKTPVAGNSIQQSDGSILIPGVTGASGNFNISTAYKNTDGNLDGWGFLTPHIREWDGSWVPNITALPPGSVQEPSFWCDDPYFLFYGGAAGPNTTWPGQLHGSNHHIEFDDVVWARTSTLFLEMGVQLDWYTSLGNITAVTKAANAVITISWPGGQHPFTGIPYTPPGSSTATGPVSFSGVSGMTQLNTVTGAQITAIGGVPGAWTITTNINSTGFTTYTSGGLARCTITRNPIGPNGLFAVSHVPGYHVGDRAKFLIEFTKATASAQGFATNYVNGTVVTPAVGKVNGIGSVGATYKYNWWDPNNPPSPPPDSTTPVLSEMAFIDLTPISGIAGTSNDGLCPMTLNGLRIYGPNMSVVVNLGGGTPGVAAGLVISQNPTGGTLVAPGSLVDLVISLGAGATVPDVVGETQAGATNDIITAGLSIGTVTSIHSDSVPVGQVISQSVAAGTVVAIHSPVSIVLSLGPAATGVIPNVVNTSVTVVAPGILAAAGFVLGGIANAPSAIIIAGNIISQFPAAGTTEPLGLAVNVVVSSGLPTLTIPDLFGLTQQQAIDLLLSLGLVPGAIGTAPSKLVPPGQVATQSPNAGNPAAVGDIVSFVISTGVLAVGTLFDFEQTVISQYANSPIILQLVQNMNLYVDQSTNFANFFNYLWNVNTAQGFGLDVWGKIVNVSRLLQIPNSTPYVGFFIDGESQPDQDWTPAGSSQDHPPVGGAFYTGYNATEAYLLDDAAYRQLILAKAFANIAITTAPALNQILQNLYGPGNAWVLNEGPMAISYNLSFDPTAVQLAILEQSGVIPTPPGVAVTINTNV